MSFWKQNGYLKQKTSSSLELISQISKVTKFLPKPKTMCNPVIRALFPNSATVHPTETTAANRRAGIQLPKCRGPEGCRGAQYSPQGQDVHGCPSVTCDPSPSEAERTPSHPHHTPTYRERGSAQPSRSMLRLTSCSSPASKSSPVYSSFLKEEERRNTWWAEEHDFFSHHFFCPSCLFPPPPPQKRRARASSNAGPRSLSHNNWGARLKGKFDCIPWALQFSSLVCFYVVPLSIWLSLEINIVTRSWSIVVWKQK